VTGKERIQQTGNTRKSSRRGTVGWEKKKGAVFRLRRECSTQTLGASVAWENKKKKD